MNKSITAYRKRTGISISFNWLILAALICLILFNSCMPRSVRNRNERIITKPSEAENTDYSHLESIQEKNENADESEILQFADLLEKNDKNSIFKDSLTPEDFSENMPLKDDNTVRMPTLNEQIKELDQKQTATDEKVDNLQKDVDEIKNTLYEIKHTLDDFKQDNPVKGKSRKDTKPVKKSSTNQNIILPDEAVQKDSRSVSNKSENAASKENSFTIKNPVVQKPETDIEILKQVQNENNQASDAPEYSETLYREAVQSFEKKDYNGTIQKLMTALNTLSKENTAKDVIFISNCNYWIGEAHYHSQNFSKAAEYYKKTIGIKNSPYADNAQIMMAESLLRLGNAEQARTYYQTLINEHPDSEFLPKARKMLQQL